MTVTQLTAEDDAEIAARYSQGASLNRLADRFGVSAMAIYRSLARTHTPTRPQYVPWAHPDVDTAEILRLRDELGWTWQKIGDHVGLSLHGARARYVRARRSPG